MTCFFIFIKLLQKVYFLCHFPYKKIGFSNNFIVVIFYKKDGDLTIYLLQRQISHGAWDPNIKRVFKCALAKNHERRRIWPITNSILVKTMLTR